MLSIMRSLISLNIHTIYSEFISQSSNYTVRDNPKSRNQGEIGEKVNVFRSIWLIIDKFIIRFILFTFRLYGKMNCDVETLPRKR